ELQAVVAGSALDELVRPVEVLRPEPPHAGVELHVHARRRPAGEIRDREREVRLPPDHVRLGLERRARVLARQRAHHEDRRDDPVAPELGRLLGGGDRERACTAVERGLRAPDGSVAVAVGLHHRAQPGPTGQQRAQVRAVALDGAEIDVGDRPLRHYAVSASSTSTRVTTPTSRPSPSTTGSRLWPLFAMIRAASWTSVSGETVVGFALIMSAALEANDLRSRASMRR